MVQQKMPITNLIKSMFTIGSRFREYEKMNNTFILKQQFMHILREVIKNIYDKLKNIFILLIALHIC